MADSYRVEQLVTNTLCIIFIIFCSLNALTGSALVGAGIFLLVDLRPEHGGNLIMVFTQIYGTEKRPGIYKAAIAMVLGGFFDMLYGITSIIAVLRKCYKFMGLYLTLLVICMSCETIAGFFTVKFQQEVDLVLEDFLFWTLQMKYVGQQEVDNYFTAAWDYIQSEYTCCGVINGTDWELAQHWRRNVTILDSQGHQMSRNLTTPLSCCRLLTRSQLHTKRFGQTLTREEKRQLKNTTMSVIYDQPCLQDPTAYNSFIDEGCLKSVAKYILQYNAAILTGAVIIVVVQIAAVLLTISLYKLAKDLKDKENHPYRVTSINKKLSSNKKLYPREMRQRYAYFDDDDDRWEARL